MKIFALPALAISISTTALAAPPLRVGLKQALDNNMIAVAATANGNSYRSKALTLKVTNKSGSVLQITMDPGLVFTADSAYLQNLVLAGAEMLAVQPFKEGSVDVQTFCAEARDISPDAGKTYGRPGMGSPQLVQLAQYIKNNRLFDDLGQEAVWVITSAHRLESIYDPARDAPSRKLSEFVAGLLNKPAPQYFQESIVENTPGQPIVIGKALKIFAQFDVKLEEDKKLSLGVFDSTGKQVQGVFQNRNFSGRKGHIFRVTFEARQVPPGPYYIRLKEGDAVIEEKKVTVE